VPGREALADPDFVPPYPELLRLDGRSALVAGAGSGIGRQTSHALSLCGAKVACVDRDKALAQAVANEVRGVAVVGDITDEADVERMVHEAENAHGPLRIAVDIVGLARYGPILETTEDDWSFSQEVNLHHAVLLTRACGRAMSSSGGGAIVFIGSVSGIAAADNHAFYGMAKSAMIGFARTAAVELGPAGVRVNVVSPGVTRTPRVAAAIGDRLAAWEAVAPLNRAADPSDVAATVLFLCSDLARHITGQNIVVDGGASVTSPYSVSSTGL